LSEASERLKKDRDKLINSFVDATRAVAPKTGQSLATSLIIALVGTMVPLPAANTFFGIAALLITAAVIIARKQIRIPQKAIIAATMLAAVSLTTGCSSAWLSELNADIVRACQEKNGDCRTGLSIGYAVLGIPVRYATLEQAQLDGSVQKVFWGETVKSFGLVTVTRLTVYGS
jgi:hypothetical protein